MDMIFFSRSVFIYPHAGPPIPIENMLIPFIICVGICCIIMIGVLVSKPQLSIKH